MTIDEKNPIHKFSIPNFCEIYKGRWAANGLICTVKEHYSDVKLLEDEKRWVEWSSTIKSHPNVVVYFCSYTRTQDDSDIQGILTEFLPSTLRDFVHNKRTLKRVMPLDFKRSILVDVVLAMR